MAFKMKRSVIKGTPAYKKAKAKVQAIDVAKAPTGPDASLVEASRLLGQAKGRTPKIDFTVDRSDIDFSALEDIEFGKRKPRVKKEKQPKVKKERKKFKLGEKIGDFFVSKAGKIRDAAGNILSGIEERRAQKEIERQKTLAEEKAKQEAFEAEKLKSKDISKIEIKTPELTSVSTPELELEKAGPTPEIKPGFGQDLQFEAIERAGYDMTDPEEIRLGLKNSTWDETKGDWKVSRVTTTGAFQGEIPEGYSEATLEDVKSFNEGEDPRVKLDPGSGKYIKEDISIKDYFEREKNKTKVTPETQTKIVETETKTTPSQQSTTITRPKEEDYRWGKTGGWKYKGKEQYDIDTQKWRESKNPIQMRDDRIFNGAIKGGKVQQNMLKSGYIPPNKR